MKVPLTWLADYVQWTEPPAALAHRLTMQGIETTYLPGPSAGWGERVVVGRVLELGPHPNADRLRLATVDTGAGIKTVVCGAPNIAAGQHIAFAGVGAQLHDERTRALRTLGAATIRGVVSEGMVCSERELGISDEHEGILVLPGDAPLGAPLAAYLPSADALEVEVTSNRGDCLSVLGVAHEVAAGTAHAVTEPALGYAESGEPNPVGVQVDDPELCARYSCTVIRGVRVGPSPEWLQQRLLAADQRPINNVVDVTNYVMLEYGQPLHAFDLGAVAQQRIVVRAAREGERLATLDGVQHELRAPMLLIADPERAIGLAGVMGGANSEMSERTTDVLLESATFDGINTRRTSAALRLRTEASTRFEKGLDPELAERAVRRATRLIAELAGGAAAPGIAEDYPRRAHRSAVRLTAGRMALVLGVEVPMERAAQVLGSLGFDVRQDGADALLATPPYWRTDVAIEDDVIEEVARIVGYDAVPEVALSGGVPEQPAQTERSVREEVRDALVTAGLQETMSHSLVSADALGGEGALAGEVGEALEVANPLSQEQRYLRTTLRWSLIAALASVVRHPPRSAALFEVGRIYLPRAGDLPEEREMAMLALAGPRARSALAEEGGAYDFYDAKGVVELLLARLGVRAAFERADDRLLHPGRAARVTVDGEAVALVGELHPSERARFDVDAPVVAVAELDVGALARRVPWVRHSFAPFPRYPAAERDLAFAADASVPAGALHALIADHPLVTGAALFDLFEGSPLPEGQRSLAFRIELQSAEGTLEAEQINDAVRAIVEKVERETGARLRA